MQFPLGFSVEDEVESYFEELVSLRGSSCNHNEREDDLQKKSLLAPPHKDIEEVELFEQRLDDFIWEEHYSAEKSDISSQLSSPVDLIKALGGLRQAVQQLLCDGENGDLQLLKCLLVSCPYDVNELKDNVGRNYLHCASAKGRNLAVAYAVRHGMAIDQPTTYNLTPLMVACSWGKGTTASLLLDLGADPTVRDTHGRTALSLAPAGLRTEVMKHPAMIKAARKAVGTDLDSNWAEHLKALQEKSVRGTGMSERYGTGLYRAASAATKASADLN
mmetsp:Transcript_67113/g.135275  ORF Transcript_67113/g.135275 Transcript_67113/m.135275 type:complete len:275 (+) Transcript_67113:65-889(+)